MRRKPLERDQSILKSCQILIVVFLLAQSADLVLAVEGKIAFTSIRDGEGAIYIMDGDGGNPFRLTEGTNPSWLPDGRSIGFLYKDSLWVTDLNGATRQNLTKGRINDISSPAAWSPDGKQIAFWGDIGGVSGVHTMDADGRGSRLIAEGFVLHDDTLSWSRDGNRIVGAPVRPIKNGFGSDIVVMNANGVNHNNLTNDLRARHINPSWSPNGKYIAYVASPDPLRWWPPHNIHVMNADGTNPVILTKEDRWAYEWNPTWSPDSRRIAFARQTPDGFHDIFTINADGGDVRNITQTHRVSEGNPAWSPPPLAVFSSGRLVTQWGNLKQGAKLTATAR